MFHSIGWGEIAVVLLAVLFLFGPDRLPTIVRDAVAGIKRIRAAIRDLRRDIDDSFGEEIAELRLLDLAQYRPQRFIRERSSWISMSPPVSRQDDWPPARALVQS